MSIVVCAPPLWRFVRAWRSASADRHPTMPPGALGLWAATALTRGGRAIVLSVEIETYLTLVCDLGSESTFPRQWKQSLEAAFEDMQVPLARLRSDTCAPRLQPVDDGRLDSVLASVEFVCDTELHFQSDLRVVQRRLNDFPHDHPPDYVPSIAVRRLFGLRS